MDELKTCSRCKQEHPISRFNDKKRKNKTGKSDYCKECESQYSKEHYLANRDKYLERQRTRREENREEISEWHKKHYLENRDKILAKQREYNVKPEVKQRESVRQARRYKENRQDIRKKQNERNSTLEIKAEVQQRSKRHYLKKPWHYVAKTGARRAARVQATPTWYKRGDATPYYKTAYDLTKRTGEKYVVDHVIPLKHDLVCGLHCKENLQVITQIENLRKHNSFIG